MATTLEKPPMYFNFDGGEVEFRGEKALIKGSLLFDFVHEFRTPNYPAIQKVGEQLKNWVEDHFRDTPDVLDACRPLVKLTMHSLAFIQPAAYTQNIDNEINMRKAFWVAALGISEWFTDDLDDEEKFRADPNYRTMNSFFSSTLLKICNFEFSTKEELKIYTEESGLFVNFPKFQGLLQVWYAFAMGFYEDPIMITLGINRKKLHKLGRALEKQYVSSSWMDGNGLEKVKNFNRYAALRYYTFAGVVQIIMTAMMDGLYEPEHYYIFRERHVEHFRFLYVTTISFLHDLLSLKKELKTGERNNAVFIWVNKGMSLQESVDKAIIKHDQFVNEAKELYNFLHKEYKEDANLLGFLDLVLKNFSGGCQFHGLCCDRYGDIKWSIDAEKKA